MTLELRSESTTMKLRSFWPLRQRPATEHQGFRTREDGVDLIEVHVAGVCIRVMDGKWHALVARRHMTRRLFPGQWECGGGQVRRGENFLSAIRRQMSEEFGLHVVPRQILETYEIHVATEQRVIPGIRFLCVAGEGDVHLNAREFSEYRWLPVPIAESLDWIGGIKEVLDVVAVSLGAIGADPLHSRAIGFAPQDVRTGDDPGGESP